MQNGTVLWGSEMISFPNKIATTCERSPQQFLDKRHLVVKLYASAAAGRTDRRETSTWPVLKMHETAGGFLTPEFWLTTTDGQCNP
jgi:hypothetical protein